MLSKLHKRLIFYPETPRKIQKSIIEVHNGVVKMAIWQSSDISILDVSQQFSSGINQLH